MKRNWLFAAVSLLLLTGAAGCQKTQKKAVKERSVRVEVQKLETRTFRHQLPLQGTVMPVEHATISSKIAGTVEVMKVDSGDLLKAGDLLFEIDRKILANQVVVKQNEISIKKDEINVKKAELNRAEHALATAEIKLKQAESDFKMADDLKAANATSRSNWENVQTAFLTAQKQLDDAKAHIVLAQAQLKQAEGNLQIAESNFKIAQDNLAYSRVYAPFDCVVTETFVEANEFVSAGKNILKLENHDRLELVSYISAVYYPQVVPGQTRVEVVDRNGKVLGSCKVTFKSPSVDPVSRTFELKAELPQELKLVSGMLCDFNLILSEKEARGLPADAMMLRGNGRYIVYTVDERGRAMAKDVTRGVIDGSYCEVVNYEDFKDVDIVISGQTFVNNNTLLDIIKKPAQAQ